MPFDIDSAAPGDSDLLSGYPATERAMRSDLESWMAIDHIEADGKHTKATLVRQGADPALSTTDAYIYSKLVGARSELFFEDDAANVIQLTDVGSASPDKVALAGDTMTGALIMNGAEIEIQAEDLKLDNARSVLGEDVAAANYRNLIQVNASDQVEVGAQAFGGGMILQSDGVDELLHAYGSGDKKIWHEGNVPTPLTETEVSGNLAIGTLGSTGSWTHALSAQPTYFQVLMKNTSTEGGWVAGDLVKVDGGAGLSTAARGFNFYLEDATTVKWSIATSAAQLQNKTTHASFDIDFTKWAFIISVAL